MKNLIIFASFVIFNFNMLTGQASSTEKAMISPTDSIKISSDKCFKNIISIGGKYYFNTLKNSQTILLDNGFILDKEAFEYQVRFYNLPKVFYYHQLGTLINTNYASVTGFGIKEDFRFPVFKNSNFIFTPYLELGGGYFKMEIARGVKSNTITSVLSSKVESHKLDNFVVTGDVGIDIGVRFKVEDKSVSILFNGGYISNFPTEWRLAGSLAFKEKINLASPYAGATLRLDLNCTE